MGWFIFSTACFQVTFFTYLLIEIQTPVAFKPGFRMECIAENNFPKKSSYGILEWTRFFSALAGLTVFRFSLPWNRLKNEWFSRGVTGSKGNGVAVVNHVDFRTRRALQTVIADLQPAASGPMTAEKQPTWTNNCWTASVFLNPQPDVPPKRTGH